MDVMHSLQINFKGTNRLPHFLLNAALKRRITSVVKISREIQVSRMTHQTLLDKKDLVPKNQRALCVNCSRKFTLFVRKTRCRVCGEVVCQSCAPQVEWDIPGEGLKRTRICVRCCNRSPDDIRLQPQDTQTFIEEKSPQPQRSRADNGSRYSLEENIMEEEEEESEDEPEDHDGLEEQSTQSVFAQSRFTRTAESLMSSTPFSMDDYDEGTSVTSTAFGWNDSVKQPSAFDASYVSYTSTNLNSSKYVLAENDTDEEIDKRAARYQSMSSTMRTDGKASAQGAQAPSRNTDTNARAENTPVPDSRRRAGSRLDASSLQVHNQRFGPSTSSRDTEKAGKDKYAVQHDLTAAIPVRATRSRTLQFTPEQATNTAAAIANGRNGSVTTGASAAPSSKGPHHVRTRIETLMFTPDEANRVAAAYGIDQRGSHDKHQEGQGGDQVSANQLNSSRGKPSRAPSPVQQTHSSSGSGKLSDERNSGDTPMTRTARNKSVYEKSSFAAGPVSTPTEKNATESPVNTPQNDADPAPVTAVRSKIIKISSRALQSGGSYVGYQKPPDENKNTMNVAKSDEKSGSGANGSGNGQSKLMQFTSQLLDSPTQVTKKKTVEQAEKVDKMNGSKASGSGSKLTQFSSQLLESPTHKTNVELVGKLDRKHGTKASGSGNKLTQFTSQLLDSPTQATNKKSGERVNGEPRINDRGSSQQALASSKIMKFSSQTSHAVAPSSAPTSKAKAFHDDNTSSTRPEDLTPVRATRSRTIQFTPEQVASSPDTMFDAVPRVSRESAHSDPKSFPSDDPIGSPTRGSEMDDTPPSSMILNQVRAKRSRTIQFSAEEVEKANAAFSSMKKAPTEEFRIPSPRDTINSLQMAEFGSVTFSDGLGSPRSDIDEELMNRPTDMIFEQVRSNRMRTLQTTPEDEVDIRSSAILQKIEREHKNRMARWNRMAHDYRDSRFSHADSRASTESIGLPPARNYDDHDIEMDWRSTETMDQAASEHEKRMEDLRLKLESLEYECRESIASVFTPEEIAESFEEDELLVPPTPPSRASVVRPPEISRPDPLRRFGRSARPVVEHEPISGANLYEQITLLTKLQSEMALAKNSGNEEEFKARIKEQYKLLRSLKVRA